MLESVFNISLAAFVAGFIFAMPVAGPISILIVSNSLNGKVRYSNLVVAGAAFADFLYVFIAVYGLSKFYSLYKPVIPYLFIGGAIFFIFLGRKVFRTRIDMEDLQEGPQISDRIKSREKGGFYTGFMINLMNPTLFLTGLISAFFVISFVASIGLNTGGLNLRIDKNVKEISEIEGKQILDTSQIGLEAIKKFEGMSKAKAVPEPEYPPYFHLVISICYALFISLGSLIWFRIFAYYLSKYRRKVNTRILAGLIKVFGVILIFLGLYFGYLGAGHFVK